MLSITYPIGAQTSFDEYSKMLYRQGGMEKAYANATPQMHLHVVEKVLQQAEIALAAHHFDLAYVKFIRAIHIIEEENLRTRLQSDDSIKVRKLLKRALCCEVDIREKHLPLLLKQQNTELNEAESERARIVALQMEQDENIPDDEERQHNERRLRLMNKDVPTTRLIAIATPADDESEDFHRKRQLQLSELTAARELQLQAKLIGEAPSKSQIPAARPAINPQTNSTAPTNLPPSVGFAIAPLVMQPQENLTVKQHPVTVQPRHPVSEPQQLVSPHSKAQSAALSVTPWKFESAVGSTGQARRGLLNIGNTCYMNSVLQCIAQTELGLYVVSSEFNREVMDENKGSIIQAFAFLMRELQVVTPQPANASRLKVEVSKVNDLFAGKSQQDANEFLRTLLDGMHEEMNTHKGARMKHPEIDNSSGDDFQIAKQYWDQYKQRNNSLIVSLFGFQERSSLVCPNCGNNPRSFHPVMGVEVPIPELSRSVSVEDCLSSYCRKEVLDGDSLYRCDKCSTKVAASKTLSFHTLPRTLVLTLKRFRSYGNFSDKVNTPVGFQKLLDMKPYLTNASWGASTQYKLVGIINHQGNMHGGHYTADVMGMRDGLWYNFSDDVVRSATEPNFKLAYTLFYLLME